MKNQNTHVKTALLAALGAILGLSAPADTVLNFDTLPPTQGQNAAIIQSFGDTASASSEGVSVVGFGTPNIGLTWQATGGRWDFYIDSVWASAQLDSSNVGDSHEVVFTPNNPGVSVIIKSFNFFPYYLSNERYTYDMTVLSGGIVVSGPVRVTFLADNLSDHPANINYDGGAGQTLTLRIARVESTLGEGEVEGGATNIAVDDITFAQLPETELSTGPSLVSINPANNAMGQAPVASFNAVLTNGTTSVNASSITLRLNGGIVSHDVTQADGLTTIKHSGTGLLPALSTNRFVLTYDDNGAPARSYTNQAQFVVAGYVDKTLPAPIVLETFDTTPEGGLPPGWSSVSLNDVSLTDPDINFTNLNSAAYTNWIVVDASRFQGSLETYEERTTTDDYRRVLTPNPSNVVNGAYVPNLATGRFAFADSGYRSDPMGQILYLFSPDFNLAGRTNVYLSFHSIWEQNQDSIASVEYSINGGTTWLPIVYMLAQASVLTNEDGSIEPSLTLGTPYGEVATWIDSSGFTQGGYYGAFIGVEPDQWPTLAPYISARVDDNPVESKRVELFRLPQADNQAAVRFRFGHAGNDSWYFGIDNVGLYSISAAPLRIASIVRSGVSVVISWEGAAGVRLQRTTSLANPNWQDVDGTAGSGSATLPASGTESYFRLARGN